MTKKAILAISDLEKKKKQNKKNLKKKKKKRFEKQNEKRVADHIGHNVDFISEGSQLAPIQIREPRSVNGVWAV